MSEGRSVDEKVFRSHLKKGAFQDGVERKKWRLIEIAWPCAFFAVKAAKRENGPDEFVIRFELTNYPQDPPIGDLWDIRENVKLSPSKRPKGEKRVSLAFRGDRNSLYLPCDRLEINGHQDWRNKHPSMLWSPEGDITQYLRIIYELLSSENYSGIGSS